MKLRNVKARLLLLALALVPLFFAGQFYNHFFDHLTGNIFAITQEWSFAALNIIIFIAFLVPLSFRRKANWGEYGLVGAFFVSLFIEMYGVPLSVFFASKFIFKEAVYQPLNTVTVNVLGINLAMSVGMVYGLALMLLGMALIVAGWATLYRKSRNGEFVSSGLYSFSRHPQYLGFILITVGWFFGWPTLLTVIFAPILVCKYVSIAKQEEQEVSKIFPQYSEYRKKTPFLA